MDFVTSLLFLTDILFNWSKNDSTAVKYESNETWRGMCLEGGGMVGTPFVLEKY